MLRDHAQFADPHLESLLPEVKSNRRGFIAAGAGMGFALATGPFNAQSVIRTPADGLDVADISVPVSGGQMPAYMAAPTAANQWLSRVHRRLR